MTDKENTAQGAGAAGQQNLKVNVPDDVRKGIYSNAVSVNVNSNEVVVDFGYLLPNTSNPEIEVVERVNMNHKTAESFLNVLSGAMEDFKKKEAKVKNSRSGGNSADKADVSNTDGEKSVSGVGSTPGSANVGLSADSAMPSNSPSDSSPAPSDSSAADSAKAPLNGSTQDPMRQGRVNGSEQGSVQQDSSGVANSAPGMGQVPSPGSPDLGRRGSDSVSPGMNASGPGPANPAPVPDLGEAKNASGSVSSNASGSVPGNASGSVPGNASGTALDEDKTSSPTPPPPPLPENS